MFNLPPESNENTMQNSIPSNEAIIEKLTENIINSCALSKNESSNSEENCENSSNNCEQSPSTSSDKHDKDSSQRSSGENESPDDFIDENILRDRDVMLDEDQKKTLLEESLLYKNEGNNAYNGGKYKISIESYTRGLKTCPLDFVNERSIMYSNRAASKYKIGLSKSAIKDCSKSIELNPQYLKVYLRRAKLYEEEEKLDEALEDYKKVLEIDPSNKEAIIANMKLPQQINERNEKLKAEMLGKLKDLGNMVLKPFGLSTNNFQMTENSETGGYSINFVNK